VGSDVFENMFMITAQLNNEAIIGCQFLKEYGVSINFDRGNLSYVRGGVLREQEFATKARLPNVISVDRSGTRESFLQNNPSTVQRPQPRSADRITTIPTRTVHSCSNPTPLQTVAAGINPERESRAGSPITSKTQCRAKEGSEGRVSLVYGAECAQINDEIKSRVIDRTEDLNIQSEDSVDRNAAQKVELEVKHVRRDLLVGNPIPRPKSDSYDTRSLRKTDVAALVEQVVSLSAVKQRRLYDVLMKYISHMTTKPGRCNLFSYKFQVDTDKPIVGYSRPIPFAIRPALREQIDQMLSDDILEVSTSPNLNPLTVVPKEGRNFRD
jgi:hypothetical protein